jgi:hypothetical protein
MLVELELEVALELQPAIFTLVDQQTQSLALIKHTLHQLQASINNFHLHTNKDP